MKKLIFPLLFGAMTTTAMAQYHNDIKPINDVNDNARQIVKGFELEDMKLVVGAPEYKYVYKSFLAGIKAKEDQLAKDLSIIAGRLSYDYSILKSLEDKKKTAAMKQTIKQAEERLETKVEAEKYTYHAALTSFINPPQDLMKKCLSALCVNQVMEDYSQWIKKAAKLNKKVKLYASFKLKKMKFKKRRTIKNYRESSESIASYLPIAIEKNDERLPFIEKYGIDVFFKYDFNDVKQFGIEMLEKHGADALKLYGPAVLEKFGLDNINKYGIQNLEKYGAVALNKYPVYQLEKYGFSLLEKYGYQNLEKHGQKILDLYGVEAIEKYGVALLTESSVEELDSLVTKFGLENVKAYGLALKKYSLKALQTYNAELLEKYGESKLDKYYAKYEDNIFYYSLEALDKFGADALGTYGEAALNKYGLANCQKFGVSDLSTWGIDLLMKYGKKNLLVINNPTAVVNGSAYSLGWNSGYESDVSLDEKTVACTAVVGSKSVAVKTSSWSVPTNFPISSNSYYTAPHRSGQMVLKQCGSNQTCRGWNVIYCAKE